MARNDGAKNLGTAELESLADWFLYRMPMQQRHDLMAELPQTYGKIFPGVSGATIAKAVSVRLNERPCADNRCSTCNRDAHRPDSVLTAGFHGHAYTS
jgi:hypothetical protein